MNTPLLEIENLSISYHTRQGEVPAVLNFNLTLYEGETVGLVGESGCGKSTVSLALLNYLGSNGKIVNGSIKFMGEDIVTMNSDRLRQLRGSSISMIYQEPFSALNPCLTIGEQLIEVPMTHEGISEQKALSRTEQLLADVRLPDTDRIIQSYPHQLSGGQQQRVVIAMALLSNPKLLLLDEPTTALDVTVEASIVKIVQDISQKYGTSMIYISHNMGLILNTCERISVMYSGQVVEEGSIKDIFENPCHPYTRGLFSCIPNLTTDKKNVPLVPIRGQLPLATNRPSGCYFGPRCDFFEKSQCEGHLIQESKVDHMHKVRCERWQQIDWETYTPQAKARQFNNIGEIILSVKKMQKSYELPNTTPLGFGGNRQEVKAVQDLTFNVRHREIVAIVGESGCGKSTFAKVMLGLEEANEGDLLLGDNDLGAIPVESRSKDLISDVQMVFQNPNDTLNPTQTIGAQISRSIRKLSEASRSEVEQKVDQLLKLVKLPTVYKHYKPSQLSGGQKQRVAIARAFAGTPRIVIADEPVSALDVSVQAAVINLLLDIQDKNDTTLVFISHDLSLVRYLADRIVVMYLGRVMEQGQTKDIFEPPYHPYTEALLSAIPVADTSIEKDEIIIEGELPSPIDPPSGCPFQTRCDYKIEGTCDVDLPPKRQFGHNQHTIFCHLDTKTFKNMNPVFRKKRKPLIQKKTSHEPKIPPLRQKAQIVSV